MNTGDIWKTVEQVKGWVLGWVWWFLQIILPCALLLLILKGSEPANYLAKYGVPMPTDISFWLYAAGIYFLLRVQKI